jgi:hypothetical protein
MSIIGSTQFLERIQFFNGERLLASDLQALESFNREMRWLHNKSLHQAGVGSGFQVTGNIGDRQVTVSPGYALDSCGREIVLTEPQVIAIPPVADNGSGGPAFYDLTVSYPEDSQLTASETRTGICMPAGVISLREAPVFCWVQLSDDATNHQPVDQRLKDRIRKALFIVLAQVQIFNCQLKQPVSTVPRRNARPSKQPRIACGAFTPGPSDWHAQGIGSTSLPFQQGLGSSGLVFPPVRIFATVDTSSAQFQSTPAYTVRLSGNRIQNDTVVPTNYWILDGLVSLSQSPPPSPKSFSIDIFPVISVVIFGTADTVSVDQSLFLGWQINWLGVES